MVINESGSNLPKIPWEEILKATAKVLNKEKPRRKGRDKLAPVSFIFVDKKRSQELNKAYRKKDAPANVLAFREEREVVLTPEIMKKEELVHMIIHGLLHLEGYDHQTDKGAREMEELEEKILSELK